MVTGAPKDKAKTNFVKIYSHMEIWEMYRHLRRSVKADDHLVNLCGEKKGKLLYISRIYYLPMISHLNFNELRSPWRT